MYTHIYPYSRRQTHSLFLYFGILTPRLSARTKDSQQASGEIAGRKRRFTTAIGKWQLKERKALQTAVQSGL